MKYDTPHRGLTWLQWYGAHNVYHPGQDLNFGVGNDDKGAEVKAWIGGNVNIYLQSLLSGIITTEGLVGLSFFTILL